MWLSERKRRFILSLTLILALAVVAALFLADRRHTSEQQSRLRTVVEEVKSLERERDDLEQELKKLDESDPDAPTRTATAQIVVTEMREELYTVIYPTMKEYGMNGVVALSDESFLDVEDPLSREQLDELMENGWDYCLFWDGSGDLETWLSDMEGYLAQESLTLPEVLYVGSRNGTWYQDAICLNHGVSIVVHRQENGDAVTAMGADAVPLVRMDQAQVDSTALPEEEMTGEDRAASGETQGERSGNMRRNTSVVATAPSERVMSADGGEPGYRFSAASASDARSSAAVSENPIVEPLQVPLTQAIASDNGMSDGGADEAVWHLDSLVWSGQDLTETVTSLVERGGNLTFELQMPFDEEKARQLDEADTLLSGSLELRSFAEARETMLEYQRSLEEWEQQREEERNRIQGRIEELSKQIDAMGSQAVNSPPSDT